DPSSYEVDAKLGGAQYVVVVNGLGATLNHVGRGEMVLQAEVGIGGAVEAEVHSCGSALTLSGGEGRALVNQYLNAGVYKADGSGDTVEFASGSFLVVPGGSTGGVLLVSGANVTMFNGSGTPDLNVEAGTLSFSSTWTGGKLTLGGGSFGGSGALTVSGFNWTGGTLGDGGGSLTSSAATISGTADHYMQGGYTWTANGTTTWSGGPLHGLVPTSL